MPSSPSKDCHTGLKSLELIRSHLYSKETFSWKLAGLEQGAYPMRGRKAK